MKDDKRRTGTLRKTTYFQDAGWKEEGRKMMMMQIVVMMMDRRHDDCGKYRPRQLLL
jgi:hypothetical protein